MGVLMVTRCLCSRVVCIDMICESVCFSDMWCHWLMFIALTLVCACVGSCMKIVVYCTFLMIFWECYFLWKWCFDGVCDDFVWYCICFVLLCYLLCCLLYYFVFFVGIVCGWWIKSFFYFKIDDEMDVIFWCF